VFTPVYQEARRWLAERMSDAGLAVQFDDAGNLVGTKKGRRSAGPALMTGSHTDTVAGAGRFDGIVGVLGGLEAVRLLTEAGLALEHDLRLVDFLGEEPNDFGLSCVGSRALAGHLQAEHLELSATTGAHGTAPGECDTLAAALQRTGLEPAAALKASLRPHEVGAFVELHVEQGPVLERAGIPLGVVSAIAGIHRMVIEVSGRPDHAGTTPMEQRKDALAAAAEAVLAVEAAGGEGGVATTGRLKVEPGAANIVPGRVRMWCEMRSADPEWLRERTESLRERLASISARRGLAIELSPLSSAAPVPAAAEIIESINNAIEKLGLPARRLISGAGHDAAHMAAVAPMGMIFVPSQGGRSHVPEEHSEVSAIACGVRALAQTLLEIDRSLEYDQAKKTRLHPSNNQRE
jgi:beta-ureidopropionase / N-carbamoyl-L-amino-acid hydrolase